VLIFFIFWLLGISRMQCHPECNAIGIFLLTCLVIPIAAQGMRLGCSVLAQEELYAPFVKATRLAYSVSGGRFSPGADDHASSQDTLSQKMG
jgi:hypothetical protein